MTDTSLSDIVKGFTAGYNANVSFVKTIYDPFVDDIKQSFQEAGLENALSNPQKIPNLTNPKNTKPSANWVVAPFIVGTTIFLATTIGSWAVNKLTDELYDARIRPALLKMAERYRQQYEAKGYDYDLDFDFRVYYETDELEVVVKAKAASAKEIETIVELIPEAEKAALAWVKEHGITSNRLTYRIKNGQLSNFPKLD